MVSQTNELLRQIENYRGIFIAATNFNTLMDEAAMRRFHIKLEFRPLTIEKLTELYKLKFTELAGEFDEKSLKDLARLNSLTPGDVHAVWSRLAYQEHVSHKEIINELRNEVSFKHHQKMITL
jgi:SpoVK/Ycf46/Vps4 family AAA+-type ATPase